MKFKLKNLINGYEDVKEDVGGRVAISKRRFFSRRISGSFAGNSTALAPLDKYNPLRRLWVAIGNTSARSLGSFLISFGALTMLLYLAADFFGMDVARIAPVIAGASLTAVSIPMFFIDGAIGAALGRNAFTSYLFFDFFGMKRLSSDSAQRGIHPLASVIVGTGLALLGYFVSFVHVCAVVLGLFLVYLTFQSPEFPLFSGLIILPVLPIIPYGDTILAVLGAVMLVSFLLKVAEGKRTLVIEQYDIVLLLMVLAVLISGIFLGGVSSFKSSLIIVGASLVYLVSSSACTNRRLAECILQSIMFSSVACAIVAIIGFAQNAVKNGFLSAIIEGCAGTLPSRTVLGAFITVAIFSALYFIKESGKIAKAVYVVVLLLDISTLVLCASVMSLIAFLAGLLSLLAIRTKRASGLLLLLILAAPYSIPFLARVPFLSDAVSLVLSKAPSELISSWASMGSVIREHIFFGVGIGEESFAAAMSEVGAGGAVSASNIFLGMACQAGVLAPALFIVMLAIRLRHRSNYSVYLAESSVGAICDVTAASSVSLLVLGTTEFIFAYPIAFYLYLAVFGLGSAALRISREDFDNRNLYYRYLRRDDSAEIYVDLRRF